MRRIGRRAAIMLAAIAVAAFPSDHGHAQTWPAEKPIRIVVPFPAGGTTDIVARMIGKHLGPALGAMIVIENRPGANGIIGSEAVAKSPADGYTFVIVAPGHASNVTLSKKLPYDTLNDFAPIMLLLQQPSLLVVHPSVPAKTTKELLALAQAQPGALSYGSGGIGSSQHLASAMFASMANIKMLHVPYKGSAPAEAGLLGGQVTMMFASMVSALPQVKEGQLRALAVSSGKRSSIVRDLPTVAESGIPGYAAVAWAGLLAPKGTPDAVVNRINAEITRIFESSEVAQWLTNLGAEFTPNKPVDFDAFIRSEIARWGEVIKASGIVAD